MDLSVNCVSPSEIKEKARQFEVPTSSIERDYTQNWLLASLYPIRMALKGGTGIRKVYIENYRFSDDLDFTLLQRYDPETITELVRNALTSVHEKSGIMFHDEVRLDQTRTGLRGTVYFQSSLTRSSIRIGIHLDLTDPLHEQILLPLQERKIIHPYSDDLDGVARVYSLEEIVAEKIRSLFQRTRPRDLYDVCNITPYVEMDNVHLIFNKKCVNKGLTPVITHLKGRKEDFSGGWIAALEHQIKPLPEFEEVFEDVLAVLKQYKIEDD